MMGIENVKRFDQFELGDHVVLCDYCEIEAMDTLDMIEHYIAKHGWVPVSSGPATGRSSEGQLWHRMIIVLGHSNPPEKRKREAVLMGLNNVVVQVGGNPADVKVNVGQRKE